MVTGGEGWRTPNESWLDMEMAEDGEIFFINVALAGKDKESGNQSKMDVPEPEEAYEKWLERQEEKTGQ